MLSQNRNRVVKQTSDHRIGRSGFMNKIRIFVIALIILLPFSYRSTALANDWMPLMERLVADGLDGNKLFETFSRPEIVFESDTMASKLETLIHKKFHKSEIPAGQYRKEIYESYLKPEVISGATTYLETNKADLEAASKHYCVPKEVLVSIMLVETKLGEFTGSKFAFNTLASMALCTNLETIQPFLSRDAINGETEDFARKTCKLKSEWAYNELKALLRYAEKNGVDPVSIPGSIYGAIGLCQFMPSNAFTFGVDADGDGKVDLFSKMDAMHSIANYLRKNGWKCKMDRHHQHRIILTYNKSNIYANTVLTIAEKLRLKTKNTGAKN